MSRASAAMNWECPTQRVIKLANFIERISRPEKKLVAKMYAMRQMTAGFLFSTKKNFVGLASSCNLLIFCGGSFR